MLTTLTILSLDQGNIYGVKRRRPMEEAETATNASLSACKERGRQVQPAYLVGAGVVQALFGWLALAFTTRRRPARS